MKKKNLLFAVIVAMFFATGLTYGQQYRNLPINRYFMAAAPDTQDTNMLDVSTLTQDSTSITWGGWDTVSIVGTGYYMWWVKHYVAGAIYELEASGYNSKTTPKNNPSDQWFISPYFSTKKYHGVALNFSSSCAEYAGPTVVALVSTNWRGGVLNPSSWDTLQGLTIAAPNGATTFPWTQSGAANLDAYQGDSVCIAFRYTSNANAAATYYLDSITITGTPNGINEISAASAKVTSYPNPVTSTVTISDASGIIKDIEIYNMVGELVSAYENVDNNKCIINIENLQQGMYFTKVILKDGTFVSNKIVKE